MQYSLFRPLLILTTLLSAHTLIQSSDLKAFWSIQSPFPLTTEWMENGQSAHALTSLSCESQHHIFMRNVWNSWMAQDTSHMAKQSYYLLSNCHGNSCHLMLI